MKSRAAALFWADLTGTPLPRPARRGPRRIGAYTEQGAPSSPAGRPAPAPAPIVVPVPAPIVVKWSGIDRRSIPKHIVGGRSVGDTAWMGTLIDNSNLRFTGAYVTGPPPPRHPAANFTASSKAVGRAWLPNIQALSDQGWGVVFFYVGFSVGGREPASPGVSRARGTAHGLHLRTTLNGLGTNWAGATVFIDNEDSDKTTLPNNLIEYYVGIFDEMSRPDPTLAAFRPALYGHGIPVTQMLERRRDLFVWDVQIETRTTTTPRPAFDPTVDPLTVDPANLPIRAYQLPPGGRLSFFTWSLGRQFWFYTGDMPSAGSAVAVRLPTWRREPDWDFDLSFVRNPAFPTGEPRIAAAIHSRAAVIVAGAFVARTPGGAALPMARVVTQEPTRSAAIAAAAGVTVEPDAPLTLFPRGNELLLATVLNGGGIGVAARIAGGTWSDIGVIAGTVPTLRRARALCGVANTVSHSHLFFIGSDNRLYVKRRRASGTWSDGQLANDALRLHPFSSLTGQARRADTVDTFFIDDQGLLATAYWARWFRTPFPGFLVQRLQTSPTLLPGGALASVCPHYDHLLVFGVGADLRLHFASFVHGRGWSAVTAAGATQDLLGPHTRLAAHGVGATEVEVAALADSGQLVLYQVRRSGATWAAAARQVIREPPPLVGGVPGAATGLQSAAGFRINPFGDLAIVREPGQRNSTVLCTGVRGRDTRTLKWTTTATDPWQSFQI